MKNLIYISRAFVEFGPFPDAELRDFLKRGNPARWRSFPPPWVGRLALAGPMDRFCSRREGCANQG
jgi:hypothetical protein